MVSNIKQRIEQFREFPHIGFFLLLLPSMRMQYMCVIVCNLLTPLLAKGLHRYRVVFVLILLALAVFNILHFYRVLRNKTSFYEKPPRLFMIAGISIVIITIIIAGLGIYINLKGE
jgi:hypothetical protein